MVVRALLMLDPPRLCFAHLTPGGTRHPESTRTKIFEKMFDGILAEGTGAGDEAPLR
jgi:hypothetical protein